LKRLAGTSTAIILILLASLFLSPLFEVKLPLQVKPECMKKAP
jgi:hypothetical protein